MEDLETRSIGVLDLGTMGAGQGPARRPDHWVGGYDLSVLVLRFPCTRKATEGYGA